MFTYCKHANHMTMTTSGQIMSWPDYLKTKGNVNIKLIVYILLSTFQSVHMVLTVNKPNVRRFIAWIESADWNPCIVGAGFGCYLCGKQFVTVHLTPLYTSNHCFFGEWDSFTKFISFAVAC